SQDEAQGGAQTPQTPDQNAQKNTPPDNSIDSDNDGLPDSEELILGTNPNAADSDNDSISDFAEMAGLTNPLNNDTDGDGITDENDSQPSIYFTDLENNPLSGDNININRFLTSLPSRLLTDFGEADRFSSWGDLTTQLASGKTQFTATTQEFNNRASGAQNIYTAEITPSLLLDFDNQQAALSAIASADFGDFGRFNREHFKYSIEFDTKDADPGNFHIAAERQVNMLNVITGNATKLVGVNLYSDLYKTGQQISKTVDQLINIGQLRISISDTSPSAPQRELLSDKFLLTPVTQP
ncbi:MAG: hypothetical protein OXU76_03500, partial [Alphaproteobacteria bacterium]|nr:hypothetical protein [Alphaproteobacteria bacterium]